MNPCLPHLCDSCKKAGFSCPVHPCGVHVGFCTEYREKPPPPQPPENVARRESDPPATFSTNGQNIFSATFRRLLR
jgi:hypothetical protein